MMTPDHIMNSRLALFHLKKTNNAHIKWLILLEYWALYGLFSDLKGSPPWNDQSSLGVSIKKLIQAMSAGAHFSKAPITYQAPKLFLQTYIMFLIRATFYWFYFKQHNGKFELKVNNIFTLYTKTDFK